MWGLVLRPFSTCSSLMSFSPFSCFLWLLSLLVAPFFSVFFSLGHHRAPFSLLCAMFLGFLFVFCWAVFHPALSLLVLFLFVFLLGRLPPSSFLTGSVLVCFLLGRLPPSYFLTGSVLVCFLLGRLPPSYFLTGSVLTSLLSLAPFTAELFQLGLVLWPSCV